ncbi:beta-1,4-galactosyltransferase galt-1-like [Montipora capricornis]|uniref:beta-1,4-galactosyltransferase galt-1-like n=1 Tax=Montipora capricornis TaxID=246305 RepID=UPI0035F15993
MTRRQMKKLLKKISFVIAVGLLFVSSLLIVSLNSSLDQKSDTLVISTMKFEGFKSTAVQNALQQFSAENVQEKDAKAENTAPLEVVIPLVEIPRSKDCFNVPKDKMQNLNFYELQPGNVIGSAFLDFRFKAQTFVRFISFLPAYGELTQLYCHFMDSERQELISSIVEIEELGTNMGYAYQGFLSTCELPDEIDSYTLCSVNISTEPAGHDQTAENTRVIPLYLVDRKVNTRTYGLCVPPISGDISAERLVEFLELSQILGVSHITFYVSKVTGNTLAILRYFAEKGLATILFWELPQIIASNVQDNGQTTALNDCLYRNLERFDYVAFNGLDEFIVPFQHQIVPQIIQEIINEDVAGYCFQSFFFYTGKCVIRDSQTLLYTQNCTFRAKTPTQTMSRCIANIKRVSSLDFNGISSPTETYYTVNNLEPSLGYVFHYDKCYSNCDDLHQDLTMKKYRHELETKVNETLIALRYSGLI